MKSKNKAVAYIWRNVVKPDRVDAFREAYGPNGAWAAYFSQSTDYLGTDLFEGRETLGYFSHTISLPSR